MDINYEGIISCLFFPDSAELFFFGFHDGIVKDRIQTANVINNSAGLVLKQHSIQVTFFIKEHQISDLHETLPRMSFLTWKEAREAFFASVFM